MIIGIIGNKGHGKDTTGDYIVENYDFEKFNFADPMKNAAMHIFDFSYDQVYDQKLKETIDKRWGITPRRALEVIGTEIFQYDVHNHIPELSDLDRKFWVYRFKLWYNRQIRPKVVINDVRFPHEHDELKEMGALTLKVHNPKIETKGTHASETEQQDIINYDHLINNDGTLEELYQKIDDIMQNIT